MKARARCLLAVALLFSPLFVGPARASCAAPSLQIRPQTVRTGATIQIIGSSFLRGCNDNGCVLSRTVRYREIELHVVQGRDFFEVAKVDPGDHGFTLQYQVRGADPGPAQIIAMAEGKILATVAFQVTAAH